MGSRARFGEATHTIIGACIEVHRHLGPGLLESAYEECLAYEMSQRGLRFERQVAVPLVFKGLRLERAYQPDFVVERAVVLEVKAVNTILSVHRAQVKTYLKLMELSVGLLVNFDVPALRDDGIRRITYSHSPRLQAQ
jgi:GxxExxY protein